MNVNSKSINFPVPLDSEAHKIAQHCSAILANRQKARRVYLNTLAIYAVNFYLQCLGFETAWEKSDSRDRISLNMMDVADLQVVKLGKLECRAVLPQADVLDIPAEVWNNRIGYVAVKLSESLKQAEIVGFVRNIAQRQGTVFLNQLQSLDRLIDHLHNLSQPPILHQWLQSFDNIYTGGWQCLEEFFGPDASLMPVLMSNRPYAAEHTVRGAKLLHLGDDRDSPNVILLITLMPQTPDSIAIRIQLHPNPGETFLPPEIQLSVLTETGKMLEKVRSRNIDNFIQLPPLHGEPGEGFQIEVALNSFNLTEILTI